MDIKKFEAMLVLIVPQVVHLIAENYNMNEYKHPASGRGNYYSMDALGKFPIAMAYVPFQTELITYTSMEALCNGTLFPELDKNFYGGKCCGSK